MSAGTTATINSHLADPIDVQLPEEDTGELPCDLVDVDDRDAIGTVDFVDTDEDRDKAGILVNDEDDIMELVCIFVDIVETCDEAGLFVDDVEDVDEIGVVQLLEDDVTEVKEVVIFDIVVDDDEGVGRGGVRTRISDSKDCGVVTNSCLSTFLWFSSTLTVRLLTSVMSFFKFSPSLTFPFFFFFPFLWFFLLFLTP